MSETKRRKCEGGCGRWLTAARSLALGLGPKCARSAAEARSAPQGPRVPPALSRRLTATNTPPLHPGQTELPLEDQ